MTYRKIAHVHFFLEPARTGGIGICTRITRFGTLAAANRE